MQLLPTLAPLASDYQDGDVRRRGVLIGDDEEMIRTMLGIGCRLKGIRFWTAGTGAEAVDTYRLHADEIGVVVLDVNMPDLDGPRAFLRLQEFNPAVACLFMSADWTPQSKELLYEAGAVGFFAKPFRLSTFIDVVRGFLDDSRDSQLPIHHLSSAEEFHVGADQTRR